MKRNIRRTEHCVINKYANGFLLISYTSIDDRIENILRGARNEQIPVSLLHDEYNDKHQRILKTYNKSVERPDAHSRLTKFWARLQTYRIPDDMYDDDGAKTEYEHTRSATGNRTKR